MRSSPRSVILGVAASLTLTLLGCGSASAPTSSPGAIAQAPSSSVVISASPSAASKPSTVAAASRSAVATPASASAKPTASAAPSASANTRLQDRLLSLNDVPAGFTTEPVQPVSAQEAASKAQDPAARLKEFQDEGRGDSVAQGFTKSGAALKDLVSGPLAILNQVIQYRDSAGAQRGLEFDSSIDKGAGGQQISVGQIGDHAAGFQFSITASGQQGIKFQIDIQRGAYLSIVQVSGLQGGVSPDDAVKLAQTADKKLG